MVSPNRSTGPFGCRNEALVKWNESNTAKAATIRFSHQIRIRFEYGAMLLSAVAAGDIDETSRLLNEGADVNYANIDLLTPLHQACIDENFAMVKLLVDNGANVNACDNEAWTPLHAAASSSSLEIVKFLVRKGANVGAINSEGELPIDLTENVQIERYLEEEIKRKGIDVDEIRESEERNMLADAEKWQKNGKVDDIRDSQGATPLHVAASKGYLDVAKLLLSIGADPNSRDDEGWTPLHAAVHWKNEELCKELIANGADINVVNNNGETPSKLADDQIKSLLQELSVKYRLSISDHEASSRAAKLPYPSKTTKQVVGILKTAKKDGNAAKAAAAAKSSTAAIPRPIQRPPAETTPAKTTGISRPPAKPEPVEKKEEIPKPAVARPTKVADMQTSPSSISRPPTSSSVTQPTKTTPKLPPSTAVSDTPETTTSVTTTSMTIDEALQKIVKLESTVAELKKERDNLLKIIDNLRSELKTSQGISSPSSSRTGASVSRPPPRP